MRKVLEYEQHAAECRQMAAHQIKNPQQKSNSKTWPMCGTGSRVRVDQGIVENNPDFTRASIIRERPTCWWLLCYRFGFQHALRVVRRAGIDGTFGTFWPFVEICNLMHLRGNKQNACDLGFETVNVSNGIVSC